MARFGVGAGGGLFALFLATFAPLQAQDPAEDAPLRGLAAAKQALEEHRHSQAIEGFKEFLNRYPDHPEKLAARLGLGIAYLETGDAKSALEHLEPAAAQAAFADRPLATHYLGLAHRALATQALADAPGKPNEPGIMPQNAKQHFETAADRFAAAVALGKDPDWNARARCDAAEVLLRLQKPREAIAMVLPLAAKGLVAEGPHRELGIFYLGYAHFLLQDYDAAGRHLSRLAPFQNGAVGPHARFLLGRVHHLADERPEALIQYEAAVAEHDQARQKAKEVLRNRDAFKDQPEELRRLEALANGPDPEHVARALLFAALVHAEDGKWGEAVTRLQAFLKRFPRDGLANEARLRLGICHVQLKQGGEALRALQPLESDPLLAPQGLRWMARAHLLAVDPNNPPASDRARKTALELFKRSLAKLDQITAPAQRADRGEILMELGETQLQLRLFKEAAETFQGLASLSQSGKRAEEALARQVEALRLAGRDAEADDAARRFLANYPNSPLRAVVLLRQAEIAYHQALGLVDKPGREAEGKALLEEAARRYEAIVAKHPGFEGGNQARLGWGAVLFRLGDYEQAASVIGGIPMSDRVGELAAASYLQADALLRLVPAEADDALSAARAQQRLSEAAKLLEAFVGSEGGGPRGTSALLRLAWCQHQAARLLADPGERMRGLQAARELYDRASQQANNTPLKADVVFERAKCILDMGDVDGAANQLRRFLADPLRSSPLAPLGIVRLASLLRARNNHREAADLLQQARHQRETQWLKDPGSHDLAILLRLQHAITLKEMGKLKEARELFESIVRDFPRNPAIDEAAWRGAQCVREELLANLAAAAKTLSQLSAKADDLAAADAAWRQSLSNLKLLGQQLREGADKAGEQSPGSESQLRLLLEAAWTYRAAAQHEIESQRRMMQTQLQKKRSEDWASAFPMQPLPPLPPPAVPLAAVPAQPAERLARETYERLLSLAAASPLTHQAALDLAEMLGDRGDQPAALKVLQTALDSEPAPELADQLRLRLALCHLSMGNVDDAQTQCEIIRQSAKGPTAAEARLRLAECAYVAAAGNKDRLDSAVALLKPFRDQAELQNVPGITDRALLLLGQAHAARGQWEESRRAFELLVSRFGQGAYVHDARFGIGWAFQNQRQLDQAIGHYQQVSTSVAGEIGARAQTQLGLCRSEQKRYAEAASALVMVPLLHDQPELSALAACEAARAYVELKQPAQAARLLERVLKDHPSGPWAELARQRLAELTAPGPDK